MTLTRNSRNTGNLRSEQKSKCQLSPVGSTEHGSFSHGRPVRAHLIAMLFAIQMAFIRSQLLRVDLADRLSAS